jgi:hypothetical protein
LAVCCLWTPAQQAHALTEPAPEACPAAPPGAAPAPPATSPAPATPAAAQILVCVDDLPILVSAYTHWSEVARKTEGSAPKHQATAREVTAEVLGFLISSDWILEEARARHIELSARTVRRQFEQIRAQQFPKPGEFGAFLETSGQTAADLELRVRLNLLSKKMLARALAEQHTSRAKQHTLTNFVRSFKHHWLSRTYCATEYAVPDCGHLVTPPL